MCIGGGQNGGVSFTLPKENCWEMEKNVTNGGRESEMK
jgi:hypothetical protein